MGMYQVSVRDSDGQYIDEDVITGTADEVAEIVESMKADAVADGFAGAYVECWEL